MTREEFARRDTALRHAIQSGVEYELEANQRLLSAVGADPKNLRVGINCSLVEHAAVTGLLIAKGVFTEQEYFDAMITALEHEVRNYERRLSERYGVNVTLA